MRLFPILLIIVCLLPAASASAQDMDAGVDSGVVHDPVTPPATSGEDAMTHDPLVECMTECGARNEMCISTAEIADCLNNIPVCAGLAPRTREITQAFCEACGRATTGCEASPPPGTGTVLAIETEPTPTPEPEHHARDRPPPPVITSSESICTRQRGVWMADAEVTMPDGRVLRGLCRTPEGADLLARIEAESRARTEGDEALGHRIDTETEERIVADAELRRDLLMNGMMDMARDSEIATLVAQIACLERRSERIALTEFDARLRARLIDSGLARDGYFICHGYHAPEPVAAATSSASTRSTTASETSSSPPEHARAPDEHPSFGQRGFARVRLQGFYWMGFRTFHPVLNQSGRSELETLPVGLGLDATLVLALERGWYAEAGAGIAYDWPDFSPYALNLGSYFHGGLRYYLIPAVSIGAGATLIQRYRPNLESTYTQLGGYLDLSFHVRFTPDVTDPSLVITVRGSAAAAFRPGVNIAPDGSLVIEIGPEF